MSISLSRVLMSAGLAVAFLAVAVPAGATATSKPPTVSGFAASPSTLYNTGGIVTLSATVTHASSCLFTSKKSVSGLPATVACTSGEVSQIVSLPANTGDTPIKYTFKLAVTGTTTIKATPVKVTIGTSPPPPLKKARSVASDGEGYCAVLSTGVVDCWGNNLYGQLGNGTFGGPDSCSGGAACFDTPTEVLGIETAVSVTSDIGGEYGSYCAVLSTGGVDCWGDNESGELGNGTTGGPDDEGGYDTPQAVIGITDAVSASGDEDGSFCAVLSTGGMDCWGDNEEGELGNGTVGGPDGPGGASGYDTPQAVSGITNAASVDSDSDGYCAVLSTGGVDCWGDNSEGELGNGTIDGPDGADGQDYDTPQAVIGVTNAASATGVFGGGYCAVLLTGGVDCWGDNYEGELGNGTVGGPDGNDGYDTSQAVSGITNAVSATSANSYSVCAVLSGGGVNCWGSNGVGELGNGTTGGPDTCSGGPFCYDTPQAVSGITNAVSAIGGSYADGFCAVLSTGVMNCWGENTAGEIGNGTVGGPDGQQGYDAPQAVTGITDAISATTGSLGGGNGNCALQSTGKLDCWGDNYNGELGNGTTGGPDGVDGYDTPQAVDSP